MPAWKSGQRVDGLLEGRARAPRRDAGRRGTACRPSGVKHGPQISAPRGALKKQPRQRRGRGPSCRRRRAPSAMPAAVGAPSVEIQMPALAVEGDVVGAGEPAVVRWSPDDSCAPASDCRVAGQQEDLPACLRPRRGRRPVRADDLEDVAVRVARRAGWPRRPARRLRARVVGQHDVDAAGDRVGLDVLGPVHRRGAEQVGGAARLDQHVGLAGEAVRRGQRALAVHQRQPRAPCRRRRTARRRACRRRAGRGWRRGRSGSTARAVTNL